MAEPLLDGSQINTGPKALRCECRTEFMQVEAILIELRSLRNYL